MIETPSEILAHHASKEASDSFVAWRKMIKKPLTERAALCIAKALMDIKAKGGDPDDALDLAQVRGWRGIEVDWYFSQRPLPSKTSPSTDKLATWAEAIRSGKDYLCRSIPSTAARELVQMGAVTQEQCKRVSVTL